MGLSAGPFPHESPPTSRSVGCPGAQSVPASRGSRYAAHRRRSQTAVHQLIHTGAALPVAWRVSYGRRGRPQAEGRTFFPAPSGLLAPASLQKSPPLRLPRQARALTGAGLPWGAHHGTPSQRGAAPTMERAMKNVAEFTIIGRVGAIKTLGKAVRVTIASNYRLKDERGEWREDTHWNEARATSH